MMAHPKKGTHRYLGNIVVKLSHLVRSLDSDSGDEALSEELDLLRRGSCSELLDVVAIAGYITLQTSKAF
jgi:hypothetical protein